jgi:hypothetical protein
MSRPNIFFQTDSKHNKAGISMEQPLKSEPTRNIPLCVATISPILCRNTLESVQDKLPNCSFTPTRSKSLQVKFLASFSEFLHEKTIISVIPKQLFS